MKKVLIVDDDPDIVLSMRTVLEKEGYQIVTAADSKECLEKIRSEKPGLIILDVMMENMSSGINAAREIKKDPDSKNIPIIMLTAIKEKLGFDFNREAGDEQWLPVDDYCEKPLNPRDLVEKVGKYLT